MTFAARRGSMTELKAIIGNPGNTRTAKVCDGSKPVEATLLEIVLTPGRIASASPHCFAVSSRRRVGGVPGVSIARDLPHEIHEDARPWSACGDWSEGRLRSGRPPRPSRMGPASHQVASSPRQSVDDFRVPTSHEGILRSADPTQFGLQHLSVGILRQVVEPDIVFRPLEPRDLRQAVRI